MTHAKNAIFWLAIGALTLGLVLLLAKGDGHTMFGIQNDAFARTIYYGVLVAVVIAGVASFRTRIGHMAHALAACLVIALVVMAVHRYSYELRDFATRLGVELAPGRLLGLSGQPDDTK